MGETSGDSCYNLSVTAQPCRREERSDEAIQQHG